MTELNYKDMWEKLKNDIQIVVDSSNKKYYDLEPDSDEAMRICIQTSAYQVVLDSMKFRENCNKKDGK
jgi:hypothetical protein